MTRVPGYWTAPGQTVTPDGQEVRGQWNDRPVSEFPVAYHVRTFVANPQWRGHSVVLQIDGVEGLADVLLNGQRIGRLSIHGRSITMRAAISETSSRSTATSARPVLCKSAKSGLRDGLRNVPFH